MSVFCLGSWGMNRSAEQTNRPWTASRFTRFVCPTIRFIPHEPPKKDTHSLSETEWQQDRPKTGSLLISNVGVKIRSNCTVAFIRMSQIFCNMCREGLNNLKYYITFHDQNHERKFWRFSEHKKFTHTPLKFVIHQAMQPKSYYWQSKWTLPTDSQIVHCCYKTIFMCLHRMYRPNMLSPQFLSPYLNTFLLLQSI